MGDAMKRFYVWAILAVLGGCAASGLYLLNVMGRPPMPVPLGQSVWSYECGFSVLDVRRTPAITAADLSTRAHGTFYVVTAKVACPYGERYVWDDFRSAYVVSNPGVVWGGRDRRYYASPEGQRLLNLINGRAANPHKVLGATETEQLAFDLPPDIEQPALLFPESLGFLAFLDELRVGRIYVPHRFNLRYE